MWPLAVLLTAIFTTLKFTGAVSWPWLGVLSPLWIMAGFSLVVLLLVLGIIGSVAIVKAKQNPGLVASL